ncbi:MAG: hypothetical protein R6V75_03585 [Bacteroidales bacterium]
MMRFLPLLFIGFLVFSAQPVHSQDFSATRHSSTVPNGFSYEQWETMTKRWQPYSAWATLVFKEGRVVEGQVVWVDESWILLQKNRLLPAISFSSDQHEKIAIADLVGIRFQESGHPYQGLIIGMLAGILPGAVTGLILAQGWTVIPAIVFGAVTSAGGGFVGSKIQKSARREEIRLENGTLDGSDLRLLKKSRLFRDSMPTLWTSSMGGTREDFERLMDYSATLSRAFPDNKWSWSVNTSLITNDIRKKIQVWHLSPFWGPADGYYETRIGLETSLTRKIGKQFEAGVLFQTVPGDVSYTYLNRYSLELGVDYQYNRSFHQNTLGVFAGWRIGPAGRYYSQKLRGTIQAGALLSDVYEHFYYQWHKLNDWTVEGEKLTQTHHWLPGAMLKLKADYYLIPGFSLFVAAEAFWIKSLWFNERTILPETEYGPQSIPAHKLNFSNFQLCGGFSVHF